MSSNRLTTSLHLEDAYTEPFMIYDGIRGANYDVRKIQEVSALRKKRVFMVEDFLDQVQIFERGPAPYDATYPEGTPASEVYVYTNANIWVLKNLQRKYFFDIAAPQLEKYAEEWGVDVRCCVHKNKIYTRKISLAFLWGVRYQGRMVRDRNLP